MWYVIQTQTGKEEAVRTWIENTVDPACFDKCLVLYYETERKYCGQWHRETKKLFPGYLFVITEDVKPLYSQLKELPVLTRLLGTGKEIVPVSAEEEAMLRRLAGETGTVEMSSAIREGDRVIINSGSLKGMESCIRKIDRHKRKAYLELPLMGETRLVEVGLEIVERR